jgi:hypothetical protein
MGSFFPELLPRYGEDPATGEQSPWYDSESSKTIAYWCEAAWEEANEDAKASEELGQIDKYIDYLAGKQWPEGRPSYRSKPVNNRMSRLFWELVALLTDLRPIADIRATVREPAFIKQEDVMNTAIRSWWRNNRIEGKLAMTIVYAILTTGFMKIEWDPTIQFGMGDFNVIPLSPRALLPLKPAYGLQSAECLIYQDIKPVGWVKRKFPRRSHLVFPDMDVSQYEVQGGAPANISPQLFQSLSPAFKRVLGRDSRKTQTSAYPMCRYREFWLKDYTANTSNVTLKMGDETTPYRLRYLVKPGGFIYPRGRLIVMAGRQVVEDCPNPYWHGQFPFAMCRLNVVPWQLYGMSALKSWKDLQDIVNQIIAGVLDMVKRAVNPPFFAPMNALSPEAWNQVDLSMPGARLAYRQTAAHEPKVVQTAQLPGFVLPFYSGITHEMDQQSGIATIDEAMRKKQIPGGDTLDQIRNSKQTPIRMQGRNIEETVDDCGAQMVPNMFQFYRGNRRVTLSGAFGQQTESTEMAWPKDLIPESADPQDFIRNFRFETMEGSLLSIQRVDKVLGLMRLRQAGDIDRKTFFKLLDKFENVYLDVNEIEKNLKQERAEGLMGMPPKGKKGGGAKGAVA